MPADDRTFLPNLPTTWDDAAFDAWSNIARLRFLQRQVAERVAREAIAVHAMIDRHPRCTTEVEQLAASLGELEQVTAELLAAHGAQHVADGDAATTA